MGADRGYSVGPISSMQGVGCNALTWLTHNPVQLGTKNVVELNPSFTEPRGHARAFAWLDIPSCKDAGARQSPAQPPTLDWLSRARVCRRDKERCAWHTSLNLFTTGSSRNTFLKMAGDAPSPIIGTDLNAFFHLNKYNRAQMVCLPLPVLRFIAHIVSSSPLLAPLPQALIPA